MKVTVCIPCYNQQDTLQRALQSVYAQTVQPLEVLVIDDGSEQPIEVASPPNPWPRVHLIRVTNRGLPNARNVALMNAEGEAFLPLDADDWIDPTYIEKTLPLLMTSGRSTRSLEAGPTDVVLTGIQEHGPARNQSYSPGFNINPRHVTAEMLLTTYNRFFYCSLFRTETLRKAGGYNGRMIHGYEDWDLWIDLLRRGIHIELVDEPLFNYDTSNPGSMLSSSERMRDTIVAEIHRHHFFAL